MNIVRSRWPNYTWIFTDGSVHTNGRAGFGVTITSINFSLTQRLPNFTQICTAEIYAIDRAITQCLLEGFDKVIIFVDSKSMIQKVANTGMNNSSDFITLKTRRDIVDATDKGIDIRLVWVPSHCGIEGNEVADQPSNIGRELCLPDNCGINFVDIFPIIKRRIWKSWDSMWRESIKSKGKEYGEVCDTHGFQSSTI